MANKPWERLIGERETEKAFKAFCAWKNLKPGERTLRTVCGILHNGNTKNVNAIHRWSKKFHWFERTGAWDNEQLRIREEATNRAVAKVIEKAATKQEITAQRILEEEASIAFSRVHRIAPWKNIPGLIDSDQLSDADLATIRSLKVTTDEDGNKKIELQFWDKMGALDKLGQNRKLWGTKEDVSPSQQNFITFFLEIVKSGELQREAERRGLVAKGEVVEAEVIEVKSDEKPESPETKG